MHSSRFSEVLTLNIKTIEIPQQEKRKPHTQLCLNYLDDNKSQSGYHTLTRADTQRGCCVPKLASL